MLKLDKFDLITHKVSHTKLYINSNLGGAFPVRQSLGMGRVSVDTG